VLFNVAERQAYDLFSIRFDSLFRRNSFYVKSGIIHTWLLSDWPKPNGLDDWAALAALMVSCRATRSPSCQYAGWL